MRCAVVVGAGAAGLAAARALAARGLAVTVLERDAVVGGRARNDVVEGWRFDRGAEFLTSFYLSLDVDRRQLPGGAAS